MFPSIADGLKSGQLMDGGAGKNLPAKGRKFNGKNG
jgi:hypothetical protein